MGFLRCAVCSPAGQPSLSAGFSRVVPFDQTARSFRMICAARSHMMTQGAIVLPAVQLPGGKPLLHPADMASRPIKAAAFRAHPQWTAGGP
jgi:hypothetical protein